MQVKILNALRSIAAVAAGYAIIVIGTVLTLSVLLDGVSYAETSPWQHVVGSLGTVLSGLLGGYVTALVAPRKPLVHAFAVVLILVAEVTWIVANGVGSNPTWFDLAGGLTLMVTTVLGARLRTHRIAPEPRPATA